MRINPLGNKLVIKPEQVVETKKGLIIIPETVTSLTEKNIRGTIVAVGPGLRNQKTGKRSLPPDVEPGDKVVLNKYAGSRMYVDREEIMLIDVSEILGVETA
jgi:chaperonin GroES